MIVVLYFLFFLSGAAALVYEVVWARSLTLVFGGSHLAVSTVLSVFMAGLALGGWLLGRRADRSRHPLRLYAALELGIAAAALLFEVLARAYPVIYPPLARLAETSPAWLTLLRVGFAVAAMLLPTTLMGGTLPVLSKLIAQRTSGLGRHLAVLYGVNTLGAVTGSLCAGFLLLPRLGVSGATTLAVATNVLVGGAAWALSRAPAVASAAVAEPTRSPGAEPAPSLPGRLVLLGIGISGFCALGYEVLWTRVLRMVMGTSVYAFTIMLAAFLTGIALGGQAHPWLARVLRVGPRWRRSVLAFAAVQLAIGACALTATYALGNLPAHASALQRDLHGLHGEFLARQVTSFVLAFAFMAVPAFFMGLAFPMAGTLHASRARAVGAAVGEVLAANTLGAILGAATAGFVLLPLFGIERALQLLTLLNVGIGLALAASLLPRARVLCAGAAAVTAAAMVALALSPSWARSWNAKFLAVYRNNQRATFDTAERVQDALANTRVLYWFEGMNETISVIEPTADIRAFVVNGRVEASTHLPDVQCQRTLGHLPMLAHPAPRKVFVLGTGSGMTLGAVLAHPEVLSVTLAEIEPGVFGATRTFGAWNHDALDSEKLRIVHNDGRNFLWTTRERFDVITADPIHPWSGGAAYLYTDEYFRTVSARLAPGGVACQWLPIYELTLEDLRSVVATFSRNFRHVAVWLTYHDAELLGSDTPFDFDGDRLARRLQDRRIAADLDPIAMGTAQDFLTYFLAGDLALRAFARGGVVNTDDNLWLEFSAPRSQGRADLLASNLASLTALRQSPEHIAPWARGRSSSMVDRLHVAALRGEDLGALTTDARAAVEALPDHAPLRFLADQIERASAGIPRPLRVESFLASQGGKLSPLTITAVAVRTGHGRAALIFVDNAARDVYGERYLEAEDAVLESRLRAEAGSVLAALRQEHAALARQAARRGLAAPPREDVVSRFRAQVNTWVARAEPP